MYSSNITGQKMKIFHSRSRWPFWNIVLVYGVCKERYYCTVLDSLLVMVLAVQFGTVLYNCTIINTEIETHSGMFQIQKSCPSVSTTFLIGRSCWVLVLVRYNCTILKLLFSKLEFVFDVNLKEKQWHIYGSTV